MNRRGTRRVFARGVLVLGAAVLTTGVAGCGDDDDASADDVGCGMLSEDTLRDLVPGTNFRSSGSIGTAQERQQSPATCDISDADTGTLRVQITISDSADEADVTRHEELVESEAADPEGCRPREELPGGGYLCVTDGAMWAARASSGRLIRVTLSDPTSPELTADEVEAAIDEIDAAADATD